MQRLFLIKHAMPVKEPARSSREWVLGPEGRAGAERLAGRLAGQGIAAVVGSVEPKARETAEVMAAALGVPASVADGLHEQEREGMPFFTDPADLEALMREFFARPGERVFGQESADQAHARYARALGAVIEAASHGASRSPGSSPSGPTGPIGSTGSIAVVSHGTVMTLFIARQNRIDPVPLWRSLGWPSAAVLSLPDLRLLEVVPTA
jgi:broad specificity phosphatase PhoE